MPPASKKFFAVELMPSANHSSSASYLSCSPLSCSFSVSDNFALNLNLTPVRGHIQKNEWPPQRTRVCKQFHPRDMAKKKRKKGNEEKMIRKTKEKRGPTKL